MWDDEENTLDNGAKSEDEGGVKAPAEEEGENEKTELDKISIASNQVADIISEVS